MNVFRYRSWRLAVCATVAAVACAAWTAGAASSSAASAGCSVGYTVSSQWTGGFTASVAITNLGSPVNSWTLTWNFTAGQQVTQGWNATYSQSGTQVTAVSESYNGDLGRGLDDDRLQRLVEQLHQPRPGELRPQRRHLHWRHDAVTPTPTPTPTPTSPTPDAHADPNPDADADGLAAEQLQMDFQRRADQPALRFPQHHRGEGPLGRELQRRVVRGRLDGELLGQPTAWNSSASPTGRRRPARCRCTRTRPRSAAATRRRRSCSTSPRRSCGT